MFVISTLEDPSAEVGAPPQPGDALVGLLPDQGLASLADMDFDARAAEVLAQPLSTASHA